MSVNVVTRSFSPERDNTNTNETVQTLEKLKTKGLSRLATLPLPGDARGTEGMPLIVRNIMCNDGLVHDLLLVCTMSNFACAFDANTGQALWQQRIGNPILGSTAIDGWMINQYWGVLSTPVVDTSTGIMYCIVWTSADQTYQKGVFFLISINIADGSYAALPVEVTASYTVNDLTQSFLAAERKQRSSLAFNIYTNNAGNKCKTVFASFGTISETATSARGWVIAFDVTNSNNSYVSAAWCSCMRYSGAGIWMAGQGVAIDSDGFLYGMTGNGNFDGVTDFGESFFKLQYTPPNGNTKADLKIVDWFTPFSDAGLEGFDPTSTKPQEDTANQTIKMNMAMAEMMPQMLPANIDRQTIQEMALASNSNMASMGAAVPTNLINWNDMDLGSGGCLIIEKLGAVLGAGKHGILYMVNKNNMGKTMPADLANPAGNYAKLLAEPIWFTFYPGNITAMPQVASDLDIYYQNCTHHMHSTPIYLSSLTKGDMLFCQGENGPLRAWNITDIATPVANMNWKYQVNFLASGNEIASVECARPMGGMPGGMITAAQASDGSNSLIFCSIPYGDANSKITNGRFLVYSADQFSEVNGQQTMVPLWDSQNFAQTYVFNKFNIPVCADKVYLPTYNAEIVIWE